MRGACPDVLRHHRALLRGERSEGMLLAAGDGTNVVPLTITTPLAPGSKIR